MKRRKYTLDEKCAWLRDRQAKAREQVQTDQPQKIAPQRALTSGLPFPVEPDGKPFRVRPLAKLMGISPEKVTELFEKESDVLDVGAGKGRERRHRCLLIWPSAVIRVFERRRVAK
jgi:hypothetical protein